MMYSMKKKKTPENSLFIFLQNQRGLKMIRLNY